MSALSRKLREGVITANDVQSIVDDLQADFVGPYIVTDVTEPLVVRAMGLVQRHSLRAYDAVQLAAILQINESLASLRLPVSVFISADVNLNIAAQAEGLTVDDPNLHP